MELLTLAAARRTLWDAGSNAPYDENNVAEVAKVNLQINRASEVFCKSGNWRGTLTRVALTQYDGQVTLPRSIQTILGVKRDSAGLLVHPIWYEFLGGSCSLNGTYGLNDLGEGYCTYRDIGDDALPLVIKSTEVDAGTLTIWGKTDTGATYYVDVDLTEAETTIATLTTKITRLHKPVTASCIEIYSLDGMTETRIGCIEPSETDANYRRYRIANSTATVEAICKRAFISAVIDLDPIIPNYTEALRTMMMALTFKDRNDNERYLQYRDEAIGMADEDRQQFDGDNQTPIFQVVKGFGVASMPVLPGTGYYS